MRIFSALRSAVVRRWHAIAVWSGVAAILIIAGTSVSISPAYDDCIVKDAKDSGGDQAAGEKSLLSIPVDFVATRSRCAFVAVNENGDAVVALATIVIAAFTVFLAMATNRLWRATNSLISISHAVEGAYVYELIEKNNVAQAVEKVSLNEDPTSYLPRVEFRVKNYGKTAAFIDNIYADLVCHPVITQTVVEGDDWHPNNEPGLQSGQATAPPFVRDIQAKFFGPEDAKRVKDGLSHIRFYGRIEYRDVWGACRTDWFCWQWNHAKGVFVRQTPKHKKK